MNVEKYITPVVDAFVRIASPQRAALRAHLRRMARDQGYADLIFALMHARGYASAAGGMRTPWRGGSGSPDAELLTDLPTLRDRARELARDDPIACGLINTFVTNVVGTGLRPRARTKREAVNEALEAVWLERAPTLYPADRLTLAEGQQLAYRSTFTDGGLLVKATKRHADDPVWCELIETDRLGDNPGYKAPEGHKVRHGVERDANGVVVAYHVRKRHPQDVVSTPADFMKFERVLAEAAVHLKLTQRPGQSREVPAFHALLEDFNSLNLLLNAGRERMIVSACLSAFIKSPERLDELFKVTAQKYGCKMEQPLEPGMIFKLHPGDEVQTLIPNFPPPELVPFVILLCRRIGAALGVSWQVVLKDFGDSSWSSARTDLVECRQVYNILRTWLMRKLLDWQWVTVLTDARLRGDRQLRGVSDADLRRVEWLGDGWSWVDPAKEMQGVRLELLTGVSVLEEVWVKLNKDPEQMWQALERQRDKLAELGLDPAQMFGIGKRGEHDELLEALNDERPSAGRSGDNGNRIRNLVGAQ